MFWAITWWVCLWILLAYFIIHAKEDDRKIIGGLIKLVLLRWLCLCVIVWTILWIRYLIKYWISEEAENIIWIFVLCTFIIFLLVCLITSIKGKWWIKNRITFLKDNRKEKIQAKKEKIANMSGKEKKKYEKMKKDWRIIIIALSIVFAPSIIMWILSIFWLVK